MKIKQIGILEKEAFSPTVVPGINSIDLSAPIAIQYELSGKCNQRCIFCYNTWKNKSVLNSISDTLLSEKRWKVVDKIIASDIFEVILSGGEPLLIPEVCDIVSRFSKENIRIYLITNGILLSKQMVNQLKEAGLEGIQISLHGSNAEIHEAITQTPGSFNKTINGIKNAVKFFDDKSININMVLMKENYTDIESMIKMLNGIGQMSFSIGFLSKAGLATSLDTNKDLILESFYKAMKISKELDVDLGISGGFPFCLFPIEEQKKIIDISANICDAGLNQLVISPNGDIRACVCLPQILGNILKDNIIEVWENDPFLHFLRNLKHVPLVCYDCDLVSICKGGCRAAAYCYYGNFERIDPIIEDKECGEC